MVSDGAALCGEHAGNDEERVLVVAGGEHEYILGASGKTVAKATRRAPRASLSLSREEFELDYIGRRLWHTDNHEVWHSNGYISIRRRLSFAIDQLCTSYSNAS